MQQKTAKTKLSQSQRQAISRHNRELRERSFVNALAESSYRARSVTIGTSFGGTVEISMRRPDSTHVFAILQPVEVIELIHQMAGAVGCHINLQPRNDFASWRNWKHTEEELAHYRGEGNFLGNGHPPHANEMPVEKKHSLPTPEQQPGLQPALMAKEKPDEQTVAAKKTVGRKRTKRTPTPT